MSSSWADARIPTYLCTRDITTICPVRGEHHAPLVGRTSVPSLFSRSSASPSHPHLIPATFIMDNINIKPILTYGHSLEAHCNDGCIRSSYVDIGRIFIEKRVRNCCVGVGVRRWESCAVLFSIFVIVSQSFPLILSHISSGIETDMQ